MTEKLLQFIWQFQYFQRTELRTVSGEEVEIIDAGSLNKNQGPDFLQARIRIAGAVFAGSVELHLKTSQWVQHRHEEDPHYRNVILHVVLEHDGDLPHSIPVLQLKGRVAHLLLQRYEQWNNTAAFVPCQKTLKDVPSLVLTSWKDRLVAERLTRKTEKIFEVLNRNHFHWEESFWQLLARNFGSRLNADLFEAVAQSLELSLLARHRTQVIQVEAMLLGQANLLEARFEESYPAMLKKEFQFYRRKYGLQRVHIKPVFHRMMPAGFPTLRLAQLAMLVQQSANLFAQVLETTRLEEGRKLFEITANDYWHYHYRFEEETAFKKKRTGSDMVDNIMINTVIPFLYAYGLHHRDEVYKTRALEWLEGCCSESNGIIRGFGRLSVDCRSAYDSQALTELKTQYCDLRRCLECSIGCHLLKADTVL
jgi:hypothetical protein